MSLSSRVLAFVGRLSAAITLAAVCASASHAAVVRTIDGAGKLTGATGVDVGGVLYDVTFVDGTCASVFSGCDNAATDFAFTTAAGAFAASQALNDSVLLDVGLGAEFDSLPGLSVGCIGGGLCQLMTPYQTAGNVALVARALNNPPPVPDASALTTTNLAFDFTNSEFLVWARWAPAAAPLQVPEPSSLALLGAAGVALGWSQRRRRFRGNDSAQ